MKIGITGTTGFVGQNLTAYLLKVGIETHPISRIELQTVSLKIIKEFDIVIHLVGKAHDLKQHSEPEEYYDVNFGLTKTLYDLFLESDVTKFIFISSVKAAADSLDTLLTEDFLPNPQTDYGKSKLMAEQYIQSKRLPQGKSYYILRPCMIHGPGNKGNLNLLYNFVRKGFPYPLASFNNKRSFLSIENLCFVIWQLLEKDVPSGVYNIADDESLSTNEVVSILAESLMQKPNLWFLPIGLITFLAKIGDRLKLPLNSERISKLTDNYVVSNSKIKDALSKELPLTAYEGLTLTAKSFKN